MSKYRAHRIKVRKEDSKKAEMILEKYQRKIYFDDILFWGDSNTVTYCLYPYISDDLEEVLNEFKQAGIQVL